ncbi:MAG: J domain-containing protein [Candidatus Omnitrophica bacterium]|nr:J domain-containing protein [Candidatus Omnitrophota bacterium]
MLGLGESATIPEIKEAYRKLALQHHPDRCPGKDKEECEEKFKQINNAHAVLVEYCLNYRFHFSEVQDAESEKNEAMRDHLKRFYDGWWGDLKE